VITVVPEFGDEMISYALLMCSLIYFDVSYDFVVVD
jgi:hypothetical protein